MQRKATYRVLTRVRMALMSNADELFHPSVSHALELSLAVGRPTLAICIGNSMGGSEIWYKYHEYCSGNGAPKSHHFYSNWKQIVKLPGVQ